MKLNLEHLETRENPSYDGPVVIDITGQPKTDEPVEIAPPVTIVVDLNPLF